ncbi:MAG: TonB-dependent receptor [Bacteroidetes bacterium B1(2017)]|nr:MAG: TonB-dependent receptor [Bacteroidetes bacterium B1(2017)]
MNHKNLLIFCLLLISLSSFAQVKGKLEDELKQPVMNAALYLSNGAQTRSNAAGEFEFKNLLPGTYQLSIQMQEQLLVIKSFVIQASTEVNLGTLVIAKNIQLKELAINSPFINRNIERMPEIRDNVIYSGKKNEVVKLTTANANLAQNNSRQIFAKVPGVHVWESDGSGVQMGIATRGLSPNRMWEFNTRQNGYDIASDPFGYPEAYFTPSVESLDRIEVIRGAASLQYGAQFGGVVNYIKKQSITNKKFGLESTQTFGSNHMFSSFNAIGGNIGKFNYYTNINYRKSDGWRQNNDYQTINGYIHLGYQLTKKIKVSAEYSKMHQLVHQPGGLTDSLFKIDPKMSLRNRNWFNLDWNIPALTAEYAINSKNQLNIKLFGLVGYRNSIGNLSAINIPDTMNSATGQYGLRRIDVDEYKNIGLEARHLFSYKLGAQKQNLAFGVRVYKGKTKRYRNLNGNRGMDYDLSVEKDERSLDQSFTTENVALFAEQLFRVNSRLSISPGIRFEHLANTSEGKYTTTLSNPLTKSKRNFMLLGLGSEYKISSGTQLYGNITQAYRPVQFSDFTPGSSSDSIDQNLKDSKGYNIDLGYRGNINKLITYDVSAFYMYYGNRIGTYSLGSKNFRTNIGSSVSKGIEAFVEITPSSFIKNNKLGNISLFISSTIQKAEYKTWNNPDPAKNQTGKQVENAPQNIHRYGINWQYKKISTSIQGSYVGGTYSDALNTETPNANSQVGYIPSYQVFDWSVQLKLKNYLSINGGINNLGNKAYFTRRGGGYPGPGLLPAEGRIWYVGVAIKL